MRMGAWGTGRLDMGWASALLVGRRDVRCRSDALLRRSYLLLSLSSCNTHAQYIHHVALNFRPTRSRSVHHCCESAFTSDSMLILDPRAPPYTPSRTSAIASSMTPTRIAVRGATCSVAKNSRRIGREEWIERSCLSRDRELGTGGGGTGRVVAGAHLEVDFEEDVLVACLLVDGDG